MDKINPILLSRINNDSNLPLYYQLVSIIKRNIAVGLIKPGDLLPTEKVLCETFGISRSTVRQAVGRLVSEGLVIRKQGKGTYFSEPKMNRRTENIYSFTSEMMSLGLKPTSKILKFEKICPKLDMVKTLGLKDERQQIFEITRIREADGEPLLLETSYIPLYILPEMKRDMIEDSSLYKLIKEKAGLTPFFAEESWEAIVLDKDVARMLNCKPGSSGFFIERYTRSETGEIYELTQSILRGDRSKFIIKLYNNGMSFNRDIGKVKYPDGDSEADNEQSGKG